MMTLLYIYLAVMTTMVIYHYVFFRPVKEIIAPDDFEFSNNWSSIWMGLTLAFIFVLTRQFFFDFYKVPTPSMVPNYPVDSMVSANKAAFGIRAPFTNSVLMGKGEPLRGEVVILKNPRNPEATFLKRVIGLPGDTIEYKNKRFVINDSPVKVIPSSDETITECFNDCYSILLDNEVPSVNGKWILDQHQYFVVGDNRDHSQDSRVWGPILESHLLGRVIN